MLSEGSSVWSPQKKIIKEQEYIRVISGPSKERDMYLMAASDNHSQMALTIMIDPPDLLRQSSFRAESRNLNFNQNKHTWACTPTLRISCTLSFLTARKTLSKLQSYLFPYRPAKKCIAEQKKVSQLPLPRGRRYFQLLFVP